MRAMPAIAAPTPIPACAPVDRPVEALPLFEAGVEVAAAGDVDFVVVLPVVCAGVEVLVPLGI